MRRELAAVLASLLSVLPGVFIASFGDGRAQYGMALVVAALPFYCAALTLCIVLVHWLVSRLGFSSPLANAAAASITAALLAALLVKAEVGLVSALASACSVLTAFVLFALFGMRKAPPVISVEPPQ